MLSSRKRVVEPMLVFGWGDAEAGYWDEVDDISEERRASRKGGCECNTLLGIVFRPLHEVWLRSDDVDPRNRLVNSHATTYSRHSNHKKNPITARPFSRNRRDIDVSVALLRARHKLCVILQILYSVCVQTSTQQSLQRR